MRKLNFVVLFMTLLVSAPSIADEATANRNAVAGVAGAALIVSPDLRNGVDGLVHDGGHIITGTVKVGTNVVNTALQGEHAAMHGISALNTEVGNAVTYEVKTLGQGHILTAALPVAAVAAVVCLAGAQARRQGLDSKVNCSGVTNFFSNIGRGLAGLFHHHRRNADRAPAVEPMSAPEASMSDNSVSDLSVKSMEPTFKPEPSPRKVLLGETSADYAY